VNVSSKVISRKTLKKNKFSVGVMKVNDKKQDPDPNPDPDPLFRCMDPWIRIYTKMSWILKTDL
jgi:hypothetical protein